MLQLQPGETFTIFRQIGDHTDASRDSYHIVATIRDAYSSTLLDTIDLVNFNNGEYKQNWNVPVNVNPQGSWIIVTTFVYTDSGHTTKSSLYSDVSDTYLIMARTNVYMGGAETFNYGKVKKIIQEEIKKIIIPEQKDIIIPKQETDLTPIIIAIQQLNNDIKSLPIPEKFNSKEIAKDIKKLLDVNLAIIETDHSANAFDFKETKDILNNHLLKIVTIETEIKNINDSKQKIDKLENIMQSFNKVLKE